MLKNITRLESKIADKVTHLYCENDTPIAVLKEQIMEFLVYIGNVEAQVKAQQEAQKALEDAAQVSETPAEPVIEPVAEPQPQENV